MKSALWVTIFVYRQIERQVVANSKARLLNLKFSIEFFGQLQSRLPQHTTALMQDQIVTMCIA